ncbi:hypothetical protein PG997_005962 [Apiospora hydei]|uniref:Uncharacterized protein n=1 Tax=Apiospora hydei TaxID=1337664 RepID=A0ABR1WMF0_9PEZI
MPQSHSTQASATATSSSSSSAMTSGRREACSGWLTATRGDEGGQAQGRPRMAAAARVGRRCITTPTTEP